MIFRVCFNFFYVKSRKMFYDNDYYEIREYILFVDYEEEETDIVNNEALFFAIAGSELIMSLVLGYWTQQIRKDKVYL